ncbi:MAG: hypothetical protein K2Y39_14355 [Candidatus Obscuribacterales bacterium]|nr:hypothetical protein [Candidatus Obscuribacterales bacterium]
MQGFDEGVSFGCFIKTVLIQCFSRTGMHPLDKTDVHIGYVIESASYLRTDQAAAVSLMNFKSVIATGLLIESALFRT